MRQAKRALTLNTDAENCVCLEGQWVTGYILEWKVMDEFHLNNIAVHEDFQRIKIGGTLIKHVSACLQQQDIMRFISIGFIR